MACLDTRIQMEERIELIIRLWDSLCNARRDSSYDSLNIKMNGSKIQQYAEINKL